MNSCNATSSLLSLVLISSLALISCAEYRQISNTPPPAGSLALTPNATHGNYGQRLFERALFDGNGRSCASCHRGAQRSLQPDAAQALYATNPDDPLFSHDAADDFAGSTAALSCQAADTGACQPSFDRFLEHATVRVPIELHPNVSAFGARRTVFVNRGIPSTLDIALETIFMSDGRQPHLSAQALDAAQGHAQVKSIGTEELAAIVAFESSEYSSRKLASYAAGGETPDLPKGKTASEKRGRDFFVTPEKKGKFGFCGMCHSGPMLNEMGVDILLPPPLTDQSPGLEARIGDRFITALVSEVNSIANRPLLWVLEDDGVKRMILSPDIGRGAITGRWADVNKFKIPSLWGSSERAPFFHDNSAKSIEALVDHYANFAAPSFGITLTTQDKTDIIAYMKLL